MIKIKDSQIIKIFITSFLLMMFFLFTFCFVSCNYAPLIVQMIVILLVVINCLCLLYFIYRIIKWIIKKILGR